MKRRAPKTAAAVDLVVDGWRDSLSSSLHVDGHKVGMAPGARVEWWFYHADYRRVRLQTVGPEPRGPFSTRDLAKQALHQVDADLVHQVELPQQLGRPADPLQLGLMAVDLLHQVAAAFRRTGTG